MPVVNNIFSLHGCNVHFLPKIQILPQSRNILNTSCLLVKNDRNAWLFPTPNFVNYGPKGGFISHRGLRPQTELMAPVRSYSPKGGLRPPRGGCASNGAYCFGWAYGPKGSCGCSPPPPEWSQWRRKGEVFERGGEVGKDRKKAKGQGGRKGAREG